MTTSLQCSRIWVDHFSISCHGKKFHSWPLMWSKWHIFEVYCDISQTSKVSYKYAVAEINFQSHVSLFKMIPVWKSTVNLTELTKWGISRFKLVSQISEKDWLSKRWAAGSRSSQHLFSGKVRYPNEWSYSAQFWLLFAIVFFLCPLCVKTDLTYGYTYWKITVIVKNIARIANAVQVTIWL